MKVSTLCLSNSVAMVIVFILFTMNQLEAQSVGIGTDDPLEDLHINGKPGWNNHANPTIAFGPALFPGGMGRIGRYFGIDSNGIFNGSFDFVRYINAIYNPIIGEFDPINSAFDVWIDGPCIADDPGLVSGFAIRQIPAGQSGLTSRFHINPSGKVGMGTANPVVDLHLNGDTSQILNGNANATMAFGPPEFAASMGRIGRYCELDSNGFPNGNYDFVRYMNADYNPIMGKFVPTDANFDVWVDGPCIAFDSTQGSNFDIAYCPAGQAGLTSRFHINRSGKVGMGTANPLVDLHLNGKPQVLLDGNANATMAFGPPEFAASMGRIGRYCGRDSTGSPTGSYDFVRYINAIYNPMMGKFDPVDANFDVWVDGPCIAPDSTQGSNFDIAYCPAGQAGLTSRFHIDNTGKVGMGTAAPREDLHVTGDTSVFLGGNANATMAFGPPEFEASMGRIGRYCELDSNGMPNGNYDFVRYMNAKYNTMMGKFDPVDANFDVWIDGPCIAFDSTQGSNFDIAYCPAGQAGLTSRFHIDRLGNVGIGTEDPLAKLDVAGAIRSYLGILRRINADTARINDVLRVDLIRTAVASTVTFESDVDIVGTLSKQSGSFKIDHPLDPQNKYLYHSFVESPDMMNIYNGNVTTDAQGDASVILPNYFEVLNIDFRYQLTVIGTFAQAIVAEEIVDGQFKIKTDKPNVKVSWQVTGVRNDPYARDNRIQVEVDKKPEKKGMLLYNPKQIVGENSGI